MYELRYYQKDTISAITKEIKLHPQTKCVAVVPCGGGKSLIISKLCSEFPNQNILIITPRRKLLLQNAALIPEAGICSGSYGNDNFENNKIVLSTFQSLISRDGRISKPDLIIIDECHLVSDDLDKSKYAKFLEQHKTVPVIGLTATPVRGNTSLFDLKTRNWKKVYEIDIMTLIREGFLMPIRAIGVEDVQISEEIDSSRIFEITKSAITDSQIKIKENKRTRNLYFARSIKHAEFIHNELVKNKQKNVYLVHSLQNDKTIMKAFNEFNKKDNKVKHLVNVAMVSIGVDLMIDSIILLRHISSFAHFYQILGRAQRCNPEIGKIDAILLDYGSNIDSYKKIIPNFLLSNNPNVRGKQSISSLKKCPNCGTLTPPTTKNCPHCEYQFLFKTNLTEISKLGDILPAKIRVGKIKTASTKQQKENLFLDEYLLDNNEIVRRFTSSGISLTKGTNCVYEATDHGNFILSHS